MFVSEIYEIEDNYAYCTNFNNWTNVYVKTDYKFSPFVLPNNHRIELKLNENLVRMGCGDATHTSASGWLQWIYALYIDTKRLYYRNSNNTELNVGLSYNFNKNTIYSIEYVGNTVKVYADDQLLITQSCEDPLTLTRHIRFDTPSISNIDSLKVKAL